MKFIQNTLWAVGLLLLLGSCKKEGVAVTVKPVAPTKEEPAKEEPTNKEFKLPAIDLNNWKVTLPVGRPDEVKPPAILDYGTNKELLPFMYNDSTEGSLVFYTYPGATTTNTKYSRTELREQMTPGSNDDNWTFKDGGNMRGTLRVSEISKGANGEPHRTIIMQIHGRLTNDQRDAIGKSDNDAPPMLKIYWYKGRVRVKTKVLKDPLTSGNDIFVKDNWGDDEGITFNEYVGFERFTLEVDVTDGKMVVTLNDKESAIYDSDDIKKWGVFENYFKAGNYLTTLDQGAFAKVNYFSLVVTH